MQILRCRASISTILAVSLLGASAANAHQAHTQTVLGFSLHPVPEGTPTSVVATVSFTGTFGGGPAHSPLQASGDPVSGDTVHFQRLELDGVAVPCGTPGASYAAIGSATTAASGVATLVPALDTSGLGGTKLGFRAVHPTGGPAGAHRYAQSTSACVDLEVTYGDPLPDGATSYTQGYYGAAPAGEAAVALLLSPATCESVVQILSALGTDTEVDCSLAEDRGVLAGFLTGPVGPGREIVPGFLPSGLAPGQNLAAQTIALLLNLELDAVLEEDASALHGAYFLNVDPVLDLVEGEPARSYDPVLTTGGALGACTDAAPLDDVCDEDSVVWSPLGATALALDEAGTSVADLLDAALDLLLSGAASVDLHGVQLSGGDLTGLIGLVNEAYDAGEPTGFVTGFDAD